jgi:hypothetical protein
MTPKYTHDCTSCEYKGTHFGYDVYHCSVSGIGLSPYGSWLARFGHEPHQYASFPSEVLYTVLTQSSVGAYRDGKPISISMDEHLTDESSRYILAIMWAVAVEHLKEYTQP